MALNFKQKSGAKRRIDSAKNHSLKPKPRQKSTKNPNLKNDKSLGQHWLKNREILDEIAAAAEIENGDFVLEIGPGLGTLTSSILRFAGEGEVLAIEFDKNLAQKLPAQFPGKNLEIINADFLNFDLKNLPKNYKVCANVPYYITSKIVEKLLTSDNKPSVAALLVQKEVAERMAAEPGELSILAIASQIYAEVSLDILVPREFFTPPPKVDSQVVVLRAREENLLEEFNRKNDCELSEKEFFRVVKAGFSAKRKKIAKSLSANLAESKEKIEQILAKAQVSPDLRAQDITIAQWLEISKIYFNK